MTKDDGMRKPRSHHLRRVRPGQVNRDIEALEREAARRQNEREIEANREEMPAHRIALPPGEEWIPARGWKPSSAHPDWKIWPPEVRDAYDRYNRSELRRLRALKRYTDMQEDLNPYHDTPELRKRQAEARAGIDTAKAELIAARDETERLNREFDQVREEWAEDRE